MNVFNLESLLIIYSTLLILSFLQIVYLIVRQKELFLNLQKSLEEINFSINLLIDQKKINVKGNKLLFVDIDEKIEKEINEFIEVSDFIIKKK